MKRVGHLRHPLDTLFSRPSHLAIMRALQDSREGMSGRAVARQAQINHQACAIALRQLESIGIIQRQGVGHTQLVRLDFNNYLVRELILPLLKKERELLARVHQEIATVFRRDALTITVFGSVARGEEVPGSDLDVLIVSEQANTSRLLEKAHAGSDSFRRKYGLRLSPIVMSAAEARKRASRSEPLFANLLREGIDLLPRKLCEVLR